MKGRSELEDEIINLIEKSGKSFGETMEALNGTQFYFLAKAETFLTDADVRNVSEASGTPHIKYAKEIMGKHADMLHEGRK